MPEANGTPIAEEAAATAAAAAGKSLLDGGDPTVVVPAAAPAQETPEAKTAREADEKRILEADPTTLNDADKAKRPVLEAAKEEKRLLETPKKDLSVEDQAKQEKLLKAKEAAEKDKKGAPETYADFKVPEGVEVNQPVLDAFKVLAKKHNLTQEGAQELIDLQVKHVQGITEGLQKTFEDTKAEWKKEAIAALGADYKKELVFASRAIEKFGTAELRVFLNQTGTGNHKDLVNFFVAVGKAISEDHIVPGAEGSGQKSDSQLFYGDTMK